MATFQYKNGLGNSAAYQVSGKPFVTGAVEVAPHDSVATEIEFPAVTKEITFSDWRCIFGGTPANAVIRVGFSANGVAGTNYISLATSSPVTLDVKARSVFITGEDLDGGAVIATGSIFASLTSIETGSIPSNWSGSSGVG